MSGKTYAYLENEVIIWARNRGIPQNSTPVAQARKTLEEVGELIEAAACLGVVEHDSLAACSFRHQYKDALGDCLVTLIVGAETAGIDLMGCLEQAYNEIKDRRGYLRPDGVFVKE